MLAIDILSKVFKQNSYLVRDFSFQNFKCCLASATDSHGFYVAIDKEFIEEIDLDYLRHSGIQELHSAIKKLDDYQPSIDKNTTLIVCADESIRTTTDIIYLEEDAYTFKKNVLFYSKHALEQFIALTNGDFTQSNLSSLVFNPVNFDVMKTSTAMDSFKFLMHLFIKLPMLTLDGSKMKKMTNLKDKIESRVSKENLTPFLEEVLATDWESVEEYGDLVDVTAFVNEA
jgi:hypothetical protein